MLCMRDMMLDCIVFTTLATFTIAPLLIFLVIACFVSSLISCDCCFGRSWEGVFGVFGVFGLAMVFVVVGVVINNCENECLGVKFGF